jgi:ferrous iron transport protein B
MTSRLLAPKDALATPALHATSRATPTASADGTSVGVTRKKTVLFLGNLNVGKTTLFNSACGRRLNVANYPGTSVAIGRGTCTGAGAEIDLIDTPGINGMLPESEDERISRDILLDERPDIVALIADGKNLRKSLLLTAQLAEYDLPLLFDINMIDEARQRGIHIDTGRLSVLLGVPVATTVATEGEGVEAFQKALPTATRSRLRVSYPARVESAIALLAKLLKDTDLSPRAVGTALLSGDESVQRFVAAKRGEEVAEQIATVTDNVQSAFNRPLSAVILEARLRAVDEILPEVQSVSPPAHLPLSEKIGAWSRRPLTGVPIAALVVVLVYLCVGKLGAGTLNDIFEGQLFNGWILPTLERACAGIPSRLITEAFIGRFGFVSLGLSLAFSVLPVLATFFFAFGVLEDSGYLPRLSVLLDGVFRKIGLNGKGVFPLVTGFSCITMAILTTRVLETKRERFIATLLLALGIPCAPVLALMLVVLGGMSIWASLTVFGIIGVQIIVLGFIAGKVLPGRQSDFILELPPMRMPRLQSLIQKTFWRLWWFAKEALPRFLLAAFVLFLLEQAGALALLEKAAKPVLTGLLGLPPESVQVAIMTVIRKESGAGYLRQLSDAGRLDNVQAVVSLLLLTFLSPCVNALLIMLKERGTKGTLSIMAFVTPYALLVGAAVNLVCRTLGVTFR